MRASRPVQVLDKAVAQGRLAHALLLYGEDLGVLEALALEVAGKLLDAGSNVQHHPDLLTLGPSGKARQIRIGTKHDEPNSVRALIHEVQLSPVVSTRKVALIREVDRLNKPAANALLKTLEEPPADTTLLLLTTRPYDLLPTIRSRCLSFRIPTGCTPLADAAWKRWLEDYAQWVGQLAASRCYARERPADAVLPVYGFVCRFSGILKALDEALWTEQKAHLSDTLDDEQVDALKVGQHRALRRRMLGEIETRTREVALAPQVLARKEARVAFVQIVEVLERCAGLLEVNFNAEAALEHFLLMSLKLWTRAAPAVPQN